MEAGARPASPCRPEDHASCTLLPDGAERCFGDVGRCESYRAFVAKNRLETAPCAPR